MRTAICLFVLLAGCGPYNFELYQRGSRDTVIGTIGRGSMEVMLHGEQYVGSYAAITATNVGVETSISPTGQVAVAPMTTSSRTNQASALLKGPGGVLRCDFIAQRGGNGVCVDSSNAVYDMLIK